MEVVNLIDLPIECIYDILSNLTIKDTFNLLKSNKFLMSLSDTRYFWIFMNKLHYKHDLSSFNSIRLLKNTFKHHYTTLCQNCAKRAYDKHFFFDELICYRCQNTVQRYKIINPTKAKRDYALTNSDLNSIQSFTEYYYYKSNFSRKYIKTYYLLTDVIKLHKCKFPDKLDYLQFIISKLHKKQKLINQRLNKERMIIERFIDLNLNFNTIKQYINLYTQNKYKYFIQKKSCTTEELFEILKYCFQLYYIVNFTYNSYETIKPNNFKWILFFGLVDIKYYPAREKYLREIADVYFKDDIDFLNSNFQRNIDRFHNIKNLLQTEYENYFISNHSTIFVYNVECLMYKMYAYIYAETTFDLDLNTDYERNLIEDDILEDFFIYNTHYRLIMYGDNKQRSLYEYRKEAYDVYCKNSNVNVLNKILKGLLDKYFG